jgi:hypothetical protein
MFYGIDNIPCIIPIDSPHSICMWEISENTIWNIVSPTKHCYAYEQCYVILPVDSKFLSYQGVGYKILKEKGYVRVVRGGHYQD